MIFRMPVIFAISGALVSQPAASAEPLAVIMLGQATPTMSRALSETWLSTWSVPAFGPLNQTLARN
jgi:hypothetical protein